MNHSTQPPEPVSAMIHANHGCVEASRFLYVASLRLFGFLVFIQYQNTCTTTGCMIPILHEYILSPKFDGEHPDLLTFIYPAGWVRLTLLILSLCIQQRQQVQHFIFSTKISQDLFLLSGKDFVHTLTVLRGRMLMMVPLAPPVGWQLFVNCWMNRHDILAYLMSGDERRWGPLFPEFCCSLPPSGSTCQFWFDSPTSCSAERRGGLTPLHVQPINTSAPPPSTLTDVPSLRPSASFFFFICLWLPLLFWMRLFSHSHFTSSCVSMSFVRPLSRTSPVWRADITSLNRPSRSKSEAPVTWPASWRPRLLRRVWSMHKAALSPGNIQRPAYSALHREMNHISVLMCSAAVLAPWRSLFRSGRSPTIWPATSWARCTFVPPLLPHLSPRPASHRNLHLASSCPPPRRRSSPPLSPRSCLDERLPSVSLLACPFKSARARRRVVAF